MVESWFQKIGWSKRFDNGAGRYLVSFGVRGVASLEFESFGVVQTDEVRRALEEFRLPRLFRGGDVRRVCPGWARQTYSVFVVRHRVGNLEVYTEYFERHTGGSYSHRVAAMALRLQVGAE